MPFFFFWGFLVWLGASVIFRFLGQTFFTPDNSLLIILSYILVVPLIMILTLPIYKIRKIQDGESRIKAAVCIAIPGMLIDAIVLIYFDQIFVNLPKSTDRIFASWLMWAYSLIIITGLLKKRERGI